MTTKLNSQIPDHITNDFGASQQHGDTFKREATEDEAKALKRRGFTTRQVEVAPMGGGRLAPAWEIVMAFEDGNRLWLGA